MTEDSTELQVQTDVQDEEWEGDKGNTGKMSLR
jgi:hypothetical protein